MKKSLMCFSVLLLAVSMTAFGGSSAEQTTTESGTVAAGTGQYNEAPMLAELVAAGKLPPVDERLPESPIVMEVFEEIGKYGGMLTSTTLSPGWNYLFRHANDIPFVEIYPDKATHRYASTGAKLMPGIAAKWESNADATEWTFWLLKGLKWSDGEPATTEDVRFLFEDVYGNEEITPVYPAWLKWGGENVKLEVIDDQSFKLTFARSYGHFLPAPASHGLSGILMIRPSHYLKQYHKKYTSMDKLKPIMAEEEFGEEEWPQFFLAMMQSGSDGNFVITGRRPTEYPTLSPWRTVDSPAPGEWILERNPYYYKVDSAGNQLPYIDRLRHITSSDAEVMNLKILSGEVDVEGTYFAKLNETPMFMESKEQGGFEVMLVKDWLDQPLIFGLNFEPADPVLKGIVQDKRFARALSMALDRDDFNETIFLGLGRPAQVAPVRGSVFYTDEFDQAYAAYDLAAANKLLDDMGLKWDDNKEFRLRPDGERLTMPITYYEVFPACTAGSQLASKYWKDIGIDAPAKLVDGGYYWTIQGANEHLIGSWGLGGASILPTWFYGGNQVWTPQWFQWYTSGGELGVEPTADGKAVYEAHDNILAAPTVAERDKWGTELFRLQAENLWVIGIVVDVPAPFIYSTKLGNISTAKERDLYAVTILDEGEQWYFK